MHEARDSLLANQNRLQEESNVKVPQTSRESQRPSSQTLRCLLDSYRRGEGVLQLKL